MEIEKLTAPEIYRLLLKFGDQLNLKGAIKTSNKIELIKLGYTEKFSKIQASKTDMLDLHTLSINMLAYNKQFKPLIKKLNQLTK